PFFCAVVSVCFGSVFVCSLGRPVSFAGGVRHGVGFGGGVGAVGVDSKIQNPKQKHPLSKASVAKASAVKNRNHQNVLIPFVKEIVPVVDLEAGRIEITPPVGLLEIN
ncbi:MAG: hypothetical protein AAF630_11455, partial [Cyanobacteria bacterium P01_C01_bin.38]